MTLSLAPLGLVHVMCLRFLISLTSSTHSTYCSSHRTISYITANAQLCLHLKNLSRAPYVHKRGRSEPLQPKSEQLPQSWAADFHARLDTMAVTTTDMAVTTGLAMAGDSRSADMTIEAIIPAKAPACALVVGLHVAVVAGEEWALEVQPLRGGKRNSSSCVYCNFVAFFYFPLMSLVLWQSRGMLMEAFCDLAARTLRSLLILVSMFLVMSDLYYFPLYDRTTGLAPSMRWYPAEPMSSSYLKCETKIKIELF